MQDLNLRPPPSQSGKLTNCSNPRCTSKITDYSCSCGHNFSIKCHITPIIAKLWPSPTTASGGHPVIGVNKNRCMPYMLSASNAFTSSSSKDIAIFSGASLYACRSSSHSILSFTSRITCSINRHCLAVKPLIEQTALLSCFFILCYLDKVAFLETSIFTFLGVPVHLHVVAWLSARAFHLACQPLFERAERLTQRAVCFLEIELDYLRVKQGTQLHVAPRTPQRLAHRVAVALDERPCKAHYLFQLVPFLCCHNIALSFN